MVVKGRVKKLKGGKGEMKRRKEMKEGMKEEITKKEAKGREEREERATMQTLCMRMKELPSLILLLAGTSPD